MHFFCLTIQLSLRLRIFNLLSYLPVKGCPNKFLTVPEAMQISSKRCRSHLKHLVNSMCRKKVIISKVVDCKRYFPFGISKKNLEQSSLANQFV